MLTRLPCLIAFLHFSFKFCSSQDDISAIINSPYSISRLEVLVLEVAVTNNGKEIANVEVKLNNNGDSFTVRNLTQRISIPPSQTIPAVFPITIMAIGPFSVEVTLTRIPGGKPIIIIKEIIAKSEGRVQYFNYATVIELCELDTKDWDVQLVVPENSVPFSPYIKLSVSGDILGPTLQHLDQLIRLPFGCGEQVLIFMVPNIVILEYLEIKGTLTPAKKDEIISLILNGYNQELVYRKGDGSFSAFPSDPAGSTWLTAYVARSFCQASKYITVDPNIVKTALNFVTSKQSPDGTFVENGRILHTDLQEGSVTSVSSMTADIVIAFLICGQTRQSSPAISKALDYLEKRLANIVDPYELTIVTYALHLAESPARDAAFEKLVAAAVKQGNQTFWGTYLKLTIQMEATSYALLTFAKRKDIIGSDPIVRWLVSKESDLGGWQSSHTTVIAIDALTSIAKIKQYCKNNMTIQNGLGDFKFDINDKNALDFQSNLMPSSTRNLKFKISGKGVAIVQVSLRYNLPPIPVISKTFAIAVTQIPRFNGTFNLLICTSYIAIGSKFNGMAIIEVEAPSGFIFNEDNLKLSQNKTLTEIKSGKTIFYNYLNQMSLLPTCITLGLTKIATVLSLKPTYAKLYDYYDSENEAIAFYFLPTLG